MDEHSVQDYDAWYDSPKGRTLFHVELACLEPMFEGLRRPRLEIGVGTGRFAEALGIEFGIDPSHDALLLARGRGVNVVEATGETLPFADATFGAVLIAFTLCFVRDPERVFAEAHRVLVASGGLVLGELPREGPWARWYARRGAEGDPSFRDAHFLAQEEIQSMLARAGFRLVSIRSSLYQPPGPAAYEAEAPRAGYDPAAGFVAALAVHE
ncbi:MAG: methyltransferase domain-containing protein [Actinomycetota bacterium]